MRAAGWEALAATTTMSSVITPHHNNSRLTNEMINYPANEDKRTNKRNYQRKYTSIVASIRLTMDCKSGKVGSAGQATTAMSSVITSTTTQD